MPGLRQLAAALESGQTSASAIVETALQRAAESSSVFIRINEGVISLAQAIDSARSTRPANRAACGYPYRAQGFVQCA